MFLVFSVTVIAVRSLGRRIPDVLGARRAAQLSIAFLVAGLLVLGAWRNPAGLYVGTAVFAFGQSLAYPALLTFALAAAPASERSAVVGTFTAFVDVAIALGAVLLGGVASLTSYGGAFLAAAVFAGAGCSCSPGFEPSPPPPSVAGLPRQRQAVPEPREAADHEARSRAS